MIVSDDRVIGITLVSLWGSLKLGRHNNNTFIDKENQYDTNVSVIKIKGSLWYQIIFIIKNA